jgi:hypothetical protein
MKSRSLLVISVAFAALFAGACGHSIGDSCSISTDCASDGSRICDTTSPSGYCTIQGCDVGTCPDGSECVQFFPVINLDKTCTQPSDCTIDEICTVGGKCAARSSEVRFCMATCSSTGDCRDAYECRDTTRMGAHGGQPVLAQGDTSGKLQPFCAAALPCTRDDQCDLGDHCDLSHQRCAP